MGKPLFKTDNIYLVWKDHYLVLQNQIVWFKMKMCNSNWRELKWVLALEFVFEFWTK